MVVCKGVWLLGDGMETLFCLTAASGDNDTVPSDDSKLVKLFTPFGESLALLSASTTAMYKITKHHYVSQSSRERHPTTTSH